MEKKQEEDTDTVWARDGKGNQSGSKQMHHGSGHLCLHRGMEIHFLLLWVLYQSHWQFLPDVSGRPPGVWWRDAQRSSHLSPSFLPESNLFITLTVRRKCFPNVQNSSVSTVHSERRVCVFLSDVCLVRFSPPWCQKVTFLLVSGGWRRKRGT